LNPSQLVFEYLPKLESLPLILAGPILRRTEKDGVTVWLALKKPQTITLLVYGTEKGEGKKIGLVILQGQRQTVSLGQNLHIVAVTAKPVGDELLRPGQIYAYSILGDRECPLLGNDYSLSYFDHQLPTLALPPDDLNHLNIVHGSCRKPHGEGKDALFCLDRMIQDTAYSAQKRPHQLFLTGDQIYGDDVADPILWLTQGIEQLLLGWSEELPLQEGTILAAELPPGRRCEIARIEGGFTAMLHGKADKAKSHLFSFGEYAAAYLLAWSPILMPHRFPTGKSLFRDRKKAKHWDKELDDINSFVNDLAEVRRALANVPVYTICDDHDVSDDWYLNREWCDRVLSKLLGKRVVQNGLLTYALFQAWGNTPEYFAEGTRGEQLLQLASLWLASQGKDDVTKTECDRYLGIPAVDESTGLPQLEQDEDVLILSRDAQALPWHYTVNSDRHEVIVLDTRTWRGYSPGEDKGLEPPMLLCHQGFEQQLEIPLAQSKPEIEATIVVLPTNLFTLGIIDRIQEFELSGNRVFSSDVGDSWNFHQEAFAQLLLSLCRRRNHAATTLVSRTIILSGDIHYSCAVRLTHWFYDSQNTSILVQLTSSAIKNSELATRLIHTKIKSLLPEPTERWLGWNHPLKLQKIPHFSRKKTQKSLKAKQSLPDWQYRVQWCKRQPAQSLPWQPLPQQRDRRYKLFFGLICWLWRNRWLQEGSEVIGRNNLSLVKFHWSITKTVIQETYWYPPWNDTGTVKSRYEISLEPEPLPPL
jgi:hypothetical protein